jgi:hypothetical protein
MGSSTVPVMDWETHTHRHAVYLNLQMQDLAIRVASDVGMHCLPHLASPRARDDLVAHLAIKPSISSHRAPPIHHSPHSAGS